MDALALSHQLKPPSLDASQTGAIFLVATSDRLARNVAYIANLMDSGLEFEAADSPKTNRLTVHILSAVAEHEAKMISERTKAALAAAKARVAKLGGDRGYRPEAPPDAALATAARKRNADHAAFAVLPVVERLRAEGITSLNAIARKLNVLGLRAPRQGDWTATAVRRLLARAA